MNVVAETGSVKVIRTGNFGNIVSWQLLHHGKIIRQKQAEHIHSEDALQQKEGEMLKALLSESLNDAIKLQTDLTKLLNENK